MEPRLIWAPSLAASWSVTRLTPGQATTSASPCKPVTHFRSVLWNRGDQKLPLHITFQEKLFYGWSIGPGRPFWNHSQGSGEGHIRTIKGSVPAIYGKRGEIFSSEGIHKLYYFLFHQFFPFLFFWIAFFIIPEKKNGIILHTIFMIIIKYKHLIIKWRRIIFYVQRNDLV